MKKFISMFLCLYAVSGPVYAETSPGAETADFLLLDTHARAVALGGAYTALAEGSSSLSYNPAGLGRSRGSEVSLMHDQYLQGLTYDYFGYASPKGFGLDVRYLNFGAISRTTISNPNGTGGTAGMNDVAVSAGYGRTFFGSLSLGAAGRYIRSDLDGVVSNGFAADAGAIASASWLPGLSLGAALLNMGPDLKSQSKSERLPESFRAGAAYAFSILGSLDFLAADASKTRSDRWRAGLGLETVLGDVVALRVGFNSRQDAGIGVAGGAGIHWRYLSFDYAFAPFGTLGNSHSLSLTYRWGPAPVKTTRSAFPLMMVAQ